MQVRILSEWPGSPRCGAVANVPDALALERIAAGCAERVDVGPETAMRDSGETAMQPKGRRR